MNIVADRIAAASELTERLRSHIAARLLDWAEALPEFHGGLVATLQRIRKHQRVEAARAAEPSFASPFEAVNSAVSVISDQPPAGWTKT
jgi:hypothetical protein